MKLIRFHIGFCLLMLALAGCQSGSGAEAGLNEPGVDVGFGDQTPDGPPGECMDDGSEGTSVTLGCS
ncbi:hypothetical protein [Roseibium aggregatum]|jgi:hypothetical protein|uniref:hypothetical protein n=1 Tax=Roseibium aggregatum TaxID=187304 RepID=UPI0012F48329|nr:hypothetical protein [Roseibium aggregatum]